MESEFNKISNEFPEIPPEIPFESIQQSVHERKEKPRILYHGSPGEIEDEIVPTAKHHRDAKEGLIVFGTPDVAFATMFMSPRPDDSWTERGRYNGVYYFVCDDQERFMKEDKGGFISALPGDSFECNEAKSMRRCEWTTRESVKPMGRKFYPSTLEAMIEKGVQVYFVDKETLDKMKSAGDHGMSILQNLQSENQKRGQNAIDMFKGIDK